MCLIFGQVYYANMSVNKTRVFGTVHTLNSGAYPDTQENMRQAVEELKVEGTLPRDVELRSNAYLNNIIEQDHWGVKQWVGPMLGFKRFDHAAIILAGIELTHKLRKGQFNLDFCGNKTASDTLHLYCVGNALR